MPYGLGRFSVWSRMFRELASATCGPEVKINGLPCLGELLPVVKFYNGRGTAEQWIKIL
jgi:hypothetical protein